MLDNNWYHHVVVNPKIELASALLLGGGLGLAFQPQLQSMVQTLARPLGMGNKAQNTYDGEYPTPQQLADKKRNARLKAGLLGAVVLGGLSLAKNYNSARQHYGLNSWDDKWLSQPPPAMDWMKKHASYYNSNVDFPGMDMARMLDTRRTSQLFTQDPWLARNNPYAANMGNAIVNAAANGNRTTSLGSIYNTAVDKIDTKLGFQGVGSAAARAAMSYATASLLTGALGLVTTLPDQVKDNLVSAGTWAGTISSILN